MWCNRWWNTSADSRASVGWRDKTLFITYLTFHTGILLWWISVDEGCWGQGAAQGSVQFDIPASLVMMNLPSTGSHPCPPPVNNRSDKIQHWATTPLPFSQSVFSFSSSASRHSFHPVGVCPWPSASLQLSGRGSDCWEQTQSPAQCPSCSADITPGNRLWLCPFPSLCPVPHPQLWCGRPGNLEFAPPHALATPLLRLTNKEAN